MAGIKRAKTWEERKERLKYYYENIKDDKQLLRIRTSLEVGRELRDRIRELGLDPDVDTIENNEQVYEIANQLAKEVNDIVKGIGLRPRKTKE